MLMLMFTVNDSCSGVYDRPFVCRSEADAIRSFGDIAVDADHPIGKHPEHFSLFQIGSYDDNTGKVEGCPPRHVVNAIDLVAKSRSVDGGQLLDFDKELRDAS